MIVTCNLCGSTFHGNIEPYCFDEQKDPDWQKSLRKYEKQKWVTVSIANHGEYKITSSNKCCTSGRGMDVPSTDKIRGYAGGSIEISTETENPLPPQQPKVTPQTLF